MPLRISAVVNTLNEESNIRLCLESVQWCDEIIVVDMHSDDSTVEIAREFTDKIFYFERVGYVEPARKFAVEKATGDWILLIDADELISVTTRKELVRVALNDSADVVMLPRKNYIMGAWIRHCGWWPDYQARFFKNGAISFSDQIHSQFIIGPDSRVLSLPATEENGIEHFSYQSSEDFVSRLNRYTTVEARHMFEAGRPFKLRKVVAIGLSEFKLRYLDNSGYKDGYRGFFLSIMMGFYRILAYIKLWELYRYRDKSVQSEYEAMKESIASGHGSGI